MATSWTDSDLTGLPVKKSHITEPRTALNTDAARRNLSSTCFTASTTYNYTDANLDGYVLRSVVTELKNATEALVNQASPMTQIVDTCSCGCTDCTSGQCYCWDCECGCSATQTRTFSDPGFLSITTEELEDPIVKKSLFDKIRYNINQLENQTFWWA